jgi:hypothetical protein
MVDLKVLAKYGYKTDDALKAASAELETALAWREDTISEFFKGDLSISKNLDKSKSKTALVLLAL